MKKIKIFLFIFNIILNLILIKVCFAQSSPELIWSQTSNPSSRDDTPLEITLDSKSLYVVGYDSSTGNAQWRIEKRNLSTGSIIWTQTNNPTAGDDIARGTAVDSTGLYVIGWDDGSITWGGNYKWRIEKRNLLDGSIIWTQKNIPSNYTGLAYAVVVDPTGLYVAGFTNSPSTQWRIEKRSLLDGTTIWTRTNSSNFGGTALGVAVDSTSLYVVGYDESISYADSQWRIEKRSLSTGGIIWTQIYNPSNYLDRASKVAVDSTGLYVAGYDSSPGSNNSQWRIEKRSLADGTTIWTQTNNPSGFPDIAYRAAIDSTGLYVAGYDFYPGSAQWRIEKRSLADGTTIWTQTNNPSSGEDIIHGIAINSTGLYVAGNDSSQGNNQWRIEKYANSILAVTPNSLDFSPIQTQLTINISNAGIGTLNWIVSKSTDWITVSPDSGNTSTGIDILTININTTGLELKAPYSGTITINAGIAGTITVPINMVVGKPLSENLDNVKLYPQPCNPATGTIKFVNITSGSTLKIYNLTGGLITELKENGMGFIEWPPGQDIVTGIYLYAITDHRGNIKKGKIAIVK